MSDKTEYEMVMEKLAFTKLAHTPTMKRIVKVRIDRLDETIRTDERQKVIAEIREWLNEQKGEEHCGDREWDIVKIEDIESKLAELFGKEEE